MGNFFTFSSGTYLLLYVVTIYITQLLFEIYSCSCFFWFNSPVCWLYCLFHFSHSVSLYSAFCSSISAHSQWSYCTVFALTSQGPAGKQCLVSVGPETVLERSQTTVLQFHHRLMLPQCLACDVV